jgi:hypothetical protein
MQQETDLCRKIMSISKSNPDFDSCLDKMFKWMAKTKKVKIKYQGICSQADYEDGKLYEVYRIKITKGEYEAIREVDKVLIDFAPAVIIAVRCLCGEVLMSINAVLEAKKQRLAVS